MSIFQVLATLFGILYIFYAVKNKPICFVFGLIGAACWAYEDFVNINLYFDGFLQCFYVLMSIYGFLQWKRGVEASKRQLSYLSIIQHVIVVGLGLLASVLMAKIGLQFFETSLPYLDAITTGFSIIATFLLVYRYIDNWIYWVLIDLAYIYIYGKQEAWLFVGIMVLYTVLAVVGFYNWKSQLTDLKQVKNRREIV